MTVAIALVCEDGVLLASDSMGASGSLASPVTKVYSCGTFPVAWTYAGTLYMGQQVGRALETEIDQVDLKQWRLRDPHAAASEIVDIIGRSVKTALDVLRVAPDQDNPHDSEFLVAGFARSPFVVHIRHDLSWELETGDRLLSIGSGHEFAAVAQSLMRHYIEGGIDLEQATAVAYRAIETVCNVSSFGVSLPVQIATTMHEAARVLGPDEVEAVGITVDRWKQLERDSLRSNFKDSAVADVPPILVPTVPSQHDLNTPFDICDTIDWLTPSANLSVNAAFRSHDNDHQIR